MMVINVVKLWGNYARARFRRALDIGAVAGSTEATSKDRRTSTPYRNQSRNTKSEGGIHWRYRWAFAFPCYMVLFTWLASNISRFSFLSSPYYCLQVVLCSEIRPSHTARAAGYLSHQTPKNALQRWGY
jgi:hypothetical protein